MNELSLKILAYFPDKDRRGKILAIALPIMGGMLSQNILNLVDIGMVGRLGDSALAAAGLAGFANFLAIAFILGLATGVQALAARRLGENKLDETAIPLNGGLILALVLGVPLTLVLINLAPAIINLLNSDPLVVDKATPYLQIRIASMIAVGMNFSFRGYWSAVHLTGLYMRTIIMMHALNIFLNWVLIFGNLGAPALGVTGAALATTISLYAGTLIYFFLGWKHARSHGFLHRLPDRHTLWTQVRVSLPSSMQQLLFAAGLVTLFWIIGKIGTRELAAANVLMTFTLVALLPAMGLGIATATLVGNALGREDPQDARLWGWNSGLITALFGLSVMILIFLAGKLFLAIFLTNPETLQVALIPLLLSGLIMPLDLAGMAIMNALFGAGYTKQPAIISIVGQWLIFLPLAYLVGPVLGYGLLGVWIMQGLYRTGQALVFLNVWRRGRWAKVSL